jgi:hypothetical protein
MSAPLTTMAGCSHTPTMPHGLGIDSGKGSLLAFSPGPGTTPTLKSRAVVFFVTMLLFGVVPTGYAMLSNNQWWRIDAVNSLPILHDYAILCLGFVSFPLLASFLWTERALIPERLLSIHKSGVLRPKHDVNTMRWERIFRNANIFAQGAGIIIGAIGSWLIYDYWSHGPVAPTWQVRASGEIHLTGWVFLIWQMPAFWCACTTYIIRAAVTVGLLHAVVKSSEVLPKPFHPDRAGGLSDVAKIGLRNQYVLAAIGVHIVCAILVATIVSKASPQLSTFVATSIVFATIAYALAGPFVFVAPLLPFRKSMLAKKTEALGKLGDGLQRAVDAAVTKLPMEFPSEEQETEINRLRALLKLVQSEPVWPFDVVTVRRFFSAFIIPFLVWLLALTPIQDAFNKLLSWILNLAVI